jgi:anti-anti-sigma factor
MAYVQLDRREEGVVLTPSTNLLGGDETDELQRVLRELGAERAPRVIVDLKKTEIMNSTATAVLLGAAMQFRDWGARIRLRNMNRQIRVPFVITGALQLFDVEDGSADAARAKAT